MTVKKLLTFLHFLLPASVSFSQGIRDHHYVAAAQSPESSVPAAPTNYEVFFYEDVNYAGRSEQVKLSSLSDTRNHSMAGLNNRVGSVKVPKGFVAVLYEHVNEKGGYGKYIELMEDCPDLSVYGLNDTVSYASVFFSVRPGGRYVRTKKINGKPIPGHWEATAVPRPKPKKPGVTKPLTKTAQ